MSCFECKLTVDGLIEEMINNRKGLSDDVQAFACYKIVPANMTASCIDFLSLYLPTVIQMTIEQFTAEGICQANKCCPPNSLETYKDFSFQDIQEKKCSTMVQLEKYVEKSIVNSPVEKFFEINMMEMFCERTFRIFAPMCQQIASGLAPRFTKTTSVLAGQSKFSKAFNC